MNPADLVVIAVIVCAVFLAVRHIIRNKKSDKGCCGGCGSGNCCNKCQSCDGHCSARKS